MAPNDDTYDPRRPNAEIENLRKFALYGAAAQVLVWIYFAFVHASRGAELTITAATGVLLAFVVPALMLSIMGRLIKAAAVLAGASVVLNLILFMRIGRELAR